VDLSAAPHTICFSSPRRSPALAVPSQRLYQCCGTEDLLYTQNTRFRDAVQELGFDYLYEEGPGDHSWAYWDKMIARTLTWLEQGC